MAVVKVASAVEPSDLVDGALFNAGGDLLEVTDTDIAVYVFRVHADGSSMDAVDRSGIPSSSRQFLLYRADPEDESDPTIVEVQSAGYSLTAFKPFDEVTVTLGMSRRLLFVQKLDLTGFKQPVITRIDNFAVDASQVDGTAANSLPDHSSFRQGDVVLLTGCSDEEEINHYEKRADIGNGETGWRPVMPVDLVQVTTLSPTTVPPTTTTTTTTTAAPGYDLVLNSTSQAGYGSEGSPVGMFNDEDPLLMGTTGGKTIILPFTTGLAPSVNIDECYLSMTAAQTTANAVQCDIFVREFSTYNIIDTYAEYTTAKANDLSGSIPWVIGPMTAGETYTSPNFQSIVNAVLDVLDAGSGWDGVLEVWLQPNGSTPIGTYYFNGQGNLAGEPVLELNYT